MFCKVQEGVNYCVEWCSYICSVMQVEKDWDKYFFFSEGLYFQDYVYVQVDMFIRFVIIYFLLNIIYEN